jgi:hypothetical protein
LASCSLRLRETNGSEKKFKRKFNVCQRKFILTSREKNPGNSNLKDFSRVAPLGRIIINIECLFNPRSEFLVLMGS